MFKLKPILLCSFVFIFIFQLTNDSFARTRNTVQTKVLNIDDQEITVPSQAQIFEEYMGVAVILLDFRKNTDRFPLQRLDYEKLIFNDADSLKGFIEENSYGRQTIYGEVQGWYKPEMDMPYDLEDCEAIDDAFYEQLYQAAVNAADHDIDFTQYDRLLVVHTGIPCAEMTNGTMGSRLELTSDDYEGVKRFSGSRFNARVPKITIAHEFGHNLGVGHTYALDCEDDIIVDVEDELEKCHYWEYQDHYSTMGSVHYMHYVPFHKFANHMFTYEQFIEVTESGEYVLSPYSAQDNRLKALQIFRGDYGPRGQASYTMEWRQPIGIDAVLNRDHPTYQGLLVRYLGWALLDMTPNSRTHVRDIPASFVADINPYGDFDLLDMADFYDAALPIGQTEALPLQPETNDGYSWVLITPKEVIGDELVVEIEFVSE